MKAILPHVTPLHVGRLALAGTTLALTLGCLSASSARADNPLLDDAPPVLHARPLLDGRHLIAAQFGMTLGDPYVRNLMAGLTYRYHFASWIGVGVDAWAGGGLTTGLTDDINAELTSQTRPFAMTTTSLRVLAHAVVEIVPLSGKAMLFSSAGLRADLHIDLGVGAAMVSGGDRIDDSVALSPMWGVGVRLFPNNWFSIGFDIKDYIIDRALASRRDGSVAKSEFGHNWLFGLSLGLSFPMNPPPDTGL